MNQNYAAMIFYYMPMMGMFSSMMVLFINNNITYYCHRYSKIENYDDKVRNSPEVRFAIQVVQAMESNNFVRFFKLVR